MDAGTDALIIDGTTGEASTQTDEEQVEVIKFAVDYVNGRVPVIAGAGSNDTRHGVQLTKDCEAVGADAILSVTPYYLKTSQQGLIEHYHAIAGAVDIPVILYDVPGRTGMTIQPKTLKELAKVDNIVALKDATGNFNHSVDNLHAVGETIDFYSGNYDTIVPLMSLGAKGVISVLANIAPKAVNQMTHAALKSDFKTARKIQADYKPLIDLLFAEPNPIPIKAAVALLGFNVGPTRLPLTAPGSELVEKIKAEMHSLGII
ncbi:4-hydroxy-tetrahydrodipicolinate synthase [Aerococcus urinae]